MSIKVTYPRTGRPGYRIPTKVNEAYQDEEVLVRALLPYHQDAIYFYEDEAEHGEPVATMTQDVVDTIYRSLWNAYTKDVITQEAHLEAEDALEHLGHVPSWRTKR